MVEIKGTHRDFILGINAQSEYLKFADSFRVGKYLREKVRDLGEGAFVDMEPKDHRGENECMPPSYYLRWGFERVEDLQWKHNYIRVAVNVNPRYIGVGELTGPDGKLQWKKLAEQIAHVMVNQDGHPQDYLCLTITGNREAKIISNASELPAMVEEAIAHPQSITSEIGPKQKLLERLKRRFIQMQS